MWNILPSTPIQAFERNLVDRFVLQAADAAANADAGANADANVSLLYFIFFGWS